MAEEEIEISETEELYEKLVLTIDKGQEPLRIDKFLMSRIEGATRNKVQQAIDNEMVLVNEKPVKNNYKVKPNDKIIVFDNRSPVGTDIVPENIPLPPVAETKIWAVPLPQAFISVSWEEVALTDVVYKLKTWFL